MDRPENVKKGDKFILLDNHPSLMGGAVVEVCDYGASEEPWFYIVRSNKRCFFTLALS